MARQLASHKALPDGFADKLNTLAAHVELTRTMQDGADIADATAAIAGELRRMARFPQA